MSPEKANRITDASACLSGTAQLTIANRGHPRQTLRLGRGSCSECLQCVSDAHELSWHPGTVQMLLRRLAQIV